MLKTQNYSQKLLKIVYEETKYLRATKMTPNIIKEHNVKS